MGSVLAGAPSTVRGALHKQLPLVNSVLLGHYRKACHCLDAILTSAGPHIVWEILAIELGHVLPIGPAHKGIAFLDLEEELRTLPTPVNHVLLAGVELSLLRRQGLQHVDHC